MVTETTTWLPDGQLRCRRPVRPCLLQLAPRAAGDHRSSSGESGATTKEGDAERGGEQGGEAQVGVVCLISTSIHLAITHYVRAGHTDEDGNDLTPRLAEILGTDPDTTRRVAAAVTDGCRDRVGRS